MKRRLISIAVVSVFLLVLSVAMGNGLLSCQVYLGLNGREGALKR